MSSFLAELFARDLLKLKGEVENFKDESNLWKKPDGISNSAGTLVLHLVGSINYFVGSLLGNTGYVRDREREFSATGIPREEMIKSIDELVKVVNQVLGSISEQELEAIYQVEFLGQKSTSFYLTNFYGHFNYHLGQINYLRRILEA